MWLLGTMATLGLGTLLTRELSRHPGRELGLILAALGVTAAAGAVLGIGFGILGPQVSAELHELGSTPLTVALFAAGVVLTASGKVLDDSLIGLLRGRVQLARNAVFSVGKLLAVGAAGVWLLGQSGTLVYATWVIGLVVSVGGLLVYLIARSGDGHSRRPAWRTISLYARSALGHQSLNLALLGPSWVLPVLMTVLVSAEANAGYFVASMLAGLAFFVPEALTYTLFAVGSRGTGDLWRGVRLTLTGSMLAAVLATLLMLIIGPLLLGFYGESYREGASVVLVLLTVASLPLTFKAHYVTLARIHGRVGGALPVILIGGVAEVVAAGIGAVVGGLNGAGIALITIMLLEAAWVAPTVVGATRAPAVAEPMRTFEPAT
jgi:O-antigen/teichoic acid export membrane protein